ncbi:gas vesicle protein [Elusimicrobium posterum]|uniref:hypothetical protein n=1 Tax=Elusimicrobium posterum TaxID=3116653 RepID=UPI003C712694
MKKIISSIMAAVLFLHVLNVPLYANTDERALIRKNLKIISENFAKEIKDFEKEHPSNKGTLKEFEKMAKSGEQIKELKIELYANAKNYTDEEYKRSEEFINKQQKKAASEIERTVEKVIKGIGYTIGGTMTGYILSMFIFDAWVADGSATYASEKAGERIMHRFGVVGAIVGFTLFCLFELRGDNSKKEFRHLESKYKIKMLKEYPEYFAEIRDDELHKLNQYADVDLFKYRSNYCVYTTALAQQSPALLKKDLHRYASTARDNPEYFQKAAEYIING